MFQIIKDIYYQKGNIKDIYLIRNILWKISKINIRERRERERERERE